MPKALLILLLLMAMALALYSGVGDAHVTASQGACITTVANSADGARLCEMLNTGHRLWAIFFDAAIAMAVLAACSLYLLVTRKA